MPFVYHTHAGVFFGDAPTLNKKRRAHDDDEEHKQNRERSFITRRSKASYHQSYILYELHFIVIMIFINQG